jgi:hypothetical protein
MIRFLVKAGALAAVNILLGLTMLWIHDSRLHYEKWETDSLLLTTPANTSFDAVFLGSSHAYLFSRFKENLEISEHALGMRFFNVALPSGGGLRPNRFILENFYEQGNSAKKAVYFLEPFVFFSIGPNDAHKFIYSEPLRFQFLKKLILDHYPLRSILTYIRSKFTYDWFFQRPEALLRNSYTLAGVPVDPAKVRARMESLYTDGFKEENFLRYAKEFERIAMEVESHGAALHIVLSPTLIGPEPGTDRMMVWLEELKKNHPFSLHVFTNAILDPKYYYDLDHLNTAGVEYFMRDFLKPALNP